MGVDREALNGADPRNGGRDRPVSGEQRCADKAHDDEVHAPGPRGHTPDAEQREERDDAALAAVIRLQDEDAVLDRDDDDEGPEDQGEDAQNGRGGQATVTCRVRGFLERVKRAGSDIAKHNAQGTEGSRSGEVIAPGAVERNTGGRRHGASPFRLFWIPGCLRETDATAPVPLSSKRPSVVTREHAKSWGVIRLLLEAPGHRWRAGSPDSDGGRRPRACCSARPCARPGRAARSPCSSASAASWSCAWLRSR